MKTPLAHHVWLPLVVLVVVHLASADDQTGVAKPQQGKFTFRGQMVHPLAVREFLPWLSDGVPAILSLDLAGVHGSDRYHNKYKSTDNSASVSISESGAPDVTFSYSVVGKCRDDVFVLRTTENGGGTGWFTSLLVVRLSDKTTKALDGSVRTQSILSLIGSFDLGDRDDGAIEVNGDQIVVGASRNRKQAVKLNVPENK